MTISLLYRCRRCTKVVRVPFESVAPTLAAALWELAFLRTTPGAGMVEVHVCPDGGETVGLMDLVGADEVKS